MRLGLAIHGSLDTLTGGYLYDRLLVEHLRRRGHTVRVTALRRTSYPRMVLDNLLPATCRALRRGAVDLLLEDALGHPAFIRANRRLRRKGLPVVALVHQVMGLQPRAALLNRWIGALERRYWRSVDALIVNSQFTLEAVRRMAGCDLQVLAAPPGGGRLGRIADGAAVAARARASGPLRLLMLANVTPNKGVGETLAALERVEGVDWRLNVAGSLELDRSCAERVRAQAAARLPPGRVRFVGALEGAALRRCLRESHVLVLPFSVESFGICLLEGMAFGLPPIASSIGGGRRLIREGWNGFLVPPGGRGLFASRIEQLGRERQRLAAMGMRALQTFERQPDWSDSFFAVERFLTALLRKRSSPTAAARPG